MDEYEDFRAMSKTKREFEKVREEKYRADSKTRLATILKKKIQTTMIGALSSIEEHLGYLWGMDKDKLTPKEQEMFDLYQRVRSEILDKGNIQARNLDAEINQYDIKWLRYTMTIPVKAIKEGK